MKKIDALMLTLGAAGLFAIVLVALINVATLIYRGPAHPVFNFAGLTAPAEVGQAPHAGQPAAQTAPATAAPADVQTAAAGVDIAAGEQVWRQCRACHTATSDGRNGVGPGLYGVVGRAVADVEGFNYSDAMRAQADQVWNVAHLDAYLERPADLVPGTRMSFAGLRDPQARHNLIAWLAQQSATPMSPEELGFGAATAPADGAAAAPDAANDQAADQPAPMSQADYDALLARFGWMNPPARSDDDRTQAEARATLIAAELPTMDYETARYYPLHFQPAIADASNEECLVCHQNVLTDTPRATSQAGVEAATALAWYQTLDTYQGEQQSFHARHLQSDYAREVMNLDCVFCHQGNDPREESPDMMPGRAAFTAPAQPEFTLRRMVNPSTTCLMCHGSFPSEIMALPGPWHEIRADFEFEPGINGCLSCHEETTRTVRHQVDYLNAGTIEVLARSIGSDVCSGCHGGRQWYNTSYPYPRHSWPGMDAEVPEWAVGRVTESDPRHAFTPVNPAE